MNDSGPDYGVKLFIETDLIIDGCQAGYVEGYALSESYSGELMDVCLRREDKGLGPVLSAADPDELKRSIAKALLSEARKPGIAEQLQIAWQRAHAEDKSEALWARMAGE